MSQPKPLTSNPEAIASLDANKSSNCASTGCGSTAKTSEIDEKLRERIAQHPCYSEDAHHHYARMHAPVAPACNIQCNYCNRKYDCANESRPGVVSEVLTPEEAAHKALVIAGKIPQMTVVGIAGPGDPLANPEKTFRTFELIAEKAPDLKLCLSTNGLALPDYINRIKELNVDHVTLTINMVDPKIGAKIYPWVHYKRRRYRGEEGARILHERQMESLDLLREADILCKVNSVMIPGINDEHLKEVNKVIRAKGAFIHNIMPLISAPEHGTYFGLKGQRGPTPSELKKLQDSLQDNMEGNIKMMRHCRQCRADAVGLLGEDRSKEFTKEKILEMKPEYNLEQRQEIHAGIAHFKAQVEAAKTKVTGEEPSQITAEYDTQRRQELNAGKENFRAQLEEAKTKISAAPKVGSTPQIQVAVASKGGGLVNQHFGHAKEFMIYEVEGNQVRFTGHRKVDHFCQGGFSEEGTLDKIIETLSDCQAVLVSKIGQSPQERLRKAGLEAIEVYDVIENAALEFYKLYLQKQQDQAQADEFQTQGV
ncbi:nitrogenase cofactor biosynthesis protein NifB [Lyngbya aestuarii]|uniref:nitrogenase cofactor biosynthesis protein NifB n=1 Tax=Lyngbya aestuarii TaxID=118322 RepID=UPI00403D8CFC